MKQGKLKNEKVTSCCSTDPFPLVNILFPKGAASSARLKSVTDLFYLITSVEGVLHFDSSSR
jgi:hypothetical protein